mmetsp:Transcript_41510/g.110711  ORF Transcript_41510/g.110711 Transcript_41510/m.110711 type:complete len:117 (+) Transcript_41510:240-590(+)
MSAMASASGSAAFDTFEEFSDRCKQLYTESPDKTRMVVKYKHSNAAIYLRCTNDRVCLKYYSDQHVDVKKYEKLNSWIMAMMIGVPEEDVVVGSAGAAPTSAGGGGAAAKKKKGKR